MTDSYHKDVRCAPGLFDLFIAWSGLTVIALIGCNMASDTPLHPMAVIGIGLIMLGTVCIFNAAIPWGKIPT